ncbi:hypothetical protein OBBRIDRAFT_808455 [Obba rivulosa]|uniref:Uncharacterized protein n=1 Tax=Obba rivulosa TaxID=1052685 RepID=A0A8E2AGS9_9APHY|nr:hypothetical protein OBBRIDRAFT_808455 [Obba rivulosa]
MSVYTLRRATSSSTYADYWIPLTSIEQKLGIWGPGLMEKPESEIFLTINHCMLYDMASPLPLPVIMSSFSTPDISSLSLSFQSTQQRLHNTYDYEDNISGNGRPQYHYSTSSPIPAQSQYTPLGLNQSPMKSKAQQYSPPWVPPIPSLQPYSLATSPVPQLAPVPSVAKSLSNKLDLNDAMPKQRRVVHLVTQKLGVYHYSMGEGDEQYAVVTQINSNPVPSSLRMKKSMPDMKTLQSQAPRLNMHTSNGNICEGYATIASPSRCSPGRSARLSAIVQQSYCARHVGHVADTISGQGGQAIWAGGEITWQSSLTRHEDKIVLMYHDEIWADMY